VPDLSGQGRGRPSLPVGVTEVRGSGRSGVSRCAHPIEGNFLERNRCHHQTHAREHVPLAVRPDARRHLHHHGLADLERDPDRAGQSCGWPAVRRSDDVLDPRAYCTEAQGDLIAERQDSPLAMVGGIADFGGLSLFTAA